MSDTDELLSFPADGGCFGCSTDNAQGLQLRFRRRGDVVSAEHVLADHFHGAPHVAHGGIVAALLDEVSCAAVWFTRERSVVTGELTVRYRRPCPVQQPLTLSARIVADDHARYVVVEADVRHANEIVATSSGRFFFSSSVAP